MSDESRNGSFEARVASRFGLMPNFFHPSAAAPELITQLWAFAEASYLDNPLPSVFKERLFVYLSRFCEARYCIVRHVGFLLGLGRPAGDAHAPHHTVQAVMELLRRPMATPEALAAALARLDVRPWITDWPEPGSLAENDLLICLTVLFLTPARCKPVASALRRAVGARDFEHLMGFLAFVRAAHFWTLMHPEIEMEEDILQLMREQKELSDLLLNDPEAGHCDMDERMFDELLALRELNERQELIKAKRQLEEKDRQKDQFIAMVAHELRNPLAAIHATSEVLGLTSIQDSRVDEISERLRRQTAMMVRMLDDLLDVSRTTLGKMSIESQQLELVSLLRDVTRDAEERVANAGQRLEVDMLDSVVPITGDRVRLTQVIDNVLSNAIKFTPEGGEIRLGLRTSDQLATISITDSGIGFNPGFEHEMFEPFIQAPQSIGRSASGLGLGLAISRKLVELHGGTLSATSSGPGSRIRIHHPTPRKRRAKTAYCRWQPACRCRGPSRPARRGQSSRR